MAELSQKDQLALHAFSVEYRKAYAEKHPMSDSQLETVQDAIRGDFEKEKAATSEASIEQSQPEQQKQREREQPEPEM